MWQAVKSYFSKPSWHRLFEVCELLLLDLIKGVVAMVCIKLFSDVSSLLAWTRRSWPVH